MKYYRRMQYEVETGEEECIVMLDSDGEGRQLEGFDASDSYTTPEFRNWWRLTVLFYSDNVFAKIADFDQRQRQYSEQVQPGSPARFSRSTWCHVFL